MFRHSIVDMGAVGDVTGIRDKINRGKDLNKRDKVGYLIIALERYVFILSDYVLIDLNRPEDGQH